LLIGRILTCNTNALAYHCKITEHILLVHRMGPGYKDQQIYGYYIQYLLCHINAHGYIAMSQL